MGNRKRVLSFMSQFRGDSRSPTPATNPALTKAQQEPFIHDVSDEPTTPPGPTRRSNTFDIGESPQPRTREERPRSTSRPMSMVQTYQPPLMDVSQDTLPELQPIFTYLNSHSNKLYQEGYFLKLDDQNINGRANTDRTWTECFAQLVGTVLSLWDAAELDAAGQDGEVLPKFINLTDSSIKMIESLPTRSSNEEPLQNVLSISTAGKNRYLLHFNSHHSLIQWTAGIRLAMFEHATLQEAYTGALIAGKGRVLNNIGVIMERTRIQHAEWARVRFGAGTPWRRCWCVISPPDEKEVQKVQKQLKKRSPYERSRRPALKGDIKFYDTKKTKKAKPIATITDAHAAFAIYPQSKPLIDASTLVKVEGSITIHSSPPTVSEGFVFVMPEVAPAISGFEMMLRWLFPVFDTFAMYGRPGRLIADTHDPKGLMFAMPKHRRYGYLEILDVTGLILEEGSSTWKESEWRKRMKELTGRRMNTIESGSQRNSRYGSRRSRNSFGPSRSRVQFDDAASSRSTPAVSWGQEPANEKPQMRMPRVDSAPPGAAGFTSPHHRSVSDAQGFDRIQNQSPPMYDGAHDQAPSPPPHAVPGAQSREGSNLRYMKDMTATTERIGSEDEQPARTSPVRELQEFQTQSTPEPVATPPAFAHSPGAVPASRPYHSPELRRANSRMSTATLSQLAGAGAVGTPYTMNMDGHNGPGSGVQGSHDISQASEDSGQRVVLSDANAKGYPANRDGMNQGPINTSNSRSSFEQRPRLPNVDSNPSTRPPAEPITYYESGPRAAQQSSTSQSNTFRSHDSPPPMAFAAPVVPNAQGSFMQSPKDSSNSHSFQTPRLQNSHTIARNPLPTAPNVQSSNLSPSNVQRTASSRTASSLGSLAQHGIDQAAFDMVAPVESTRQQPRLPELQIHRQSSNTCSVYEDKVSPESPDYASARQSVDGRRSVEKPRAGVLKTVGNSDSEGGSHSEGLGSSFNVDFGPTLNYASDRLPGQQSPSRGAGPDPTQTPNKALPRSISPGPGVPFGSNRPSGSPSSRPNSSGQSLSPNRNSVTPESSHNRSYSNESRTRAWQPGMGAAGSRSRSINPEQFVQQRAAAATSMYGHQRQSSSGNLFRGNTPTPNSRHSSVDLLQRPNSRGSSVILGPSSTSDLPSRLSAQEQEHMARMTGQPFINMARNSQSSPSGGLIGAIEEREREKQQLKQGLSNQAVVEQSMAAQRQQAQFQQQTEQAYFQQQYGNMTQFLPQYSGNPLPPQRQQSWGPSAASVYTQQAWNNERPQGPPRTYPLPQQQFFEQHPQYSQQQHWGQGRGNQGYQGPRY